MKTRSKISLLVLFVATIVTSVYATKDIRTVQIPLRHFDGCNCLVKNGSCLPTIIITPSPSPAPKFVEKGNIATVAE
ncbi:hypothetical protein K5X82_04630 [Halosquirtibacter xylanolyticus]|uniref:hypothetical protein n=1 Tax=Halosquirtibacter xylanolyticus TaxID=3374599 RepID=UPI00374A4012|nr:hypothetical protein K5X82_04630 [Prolixibacteraceae bacterium]